MLKIRLQRIGRKNDPSFRVVVTEHTRGPKSEKHVDRVGFYNPKTKEQKLDADRITHWLQNGAQASGTVHNMLVQAGIVKGEKVNVLPQKSPVVKEEAEEEKKEEAPAEGDEEAGEASSDDSTEEAEAETTEDATPSEEGDDKKEDTAEEAPAEDAPADTEEEKKEDE